MNLPYVLSLYLWIAPHVLLAVVAAILLKNGRYREFPFFFVYVSFEAFQFCLLFAMSWLDSVSFATYTQVDLLCRTGSIALHFGIIKELFEAPLAHCPSVRRSIAWPIHIASVLFVVLASLFTTFYYFAGGSTTAVAPYVIEQALDTAQCGLLVVVFAWHRFLGISMSNATFGIALGLGLVTGLEPLLHAWRNYLATDSGVPNIVRAAAFHISVLVWIYFAQVREKVPDVPDTYHPIDVPGWNAELTRFSQL